MSGPTRISGNRQSAEPGSTCSRCGGGQPDLYVNDNGMCDPCADTVRAVSRLRRALGARETFLQDQARVPSRYAGSDFVELDRWPETRGGLSLATWAGEPSTFTLLGDVGTGKTFAAVERLWRLARKSVADRVAALERGELPAYRPGATAAPSALFVRASEIPGALYARNGRTDHTQRRAFGGAKESLAGLYDRLAGADLLLVDDLGRGHGGGRWDAVAELVASRHDGERPTLVTTNLELADIAPIDPSLADRLAGGAVARMSGASRRVAP